MKSRSRDGRVAGFLVQDHLFYASDYFDTLYAFAQHFIERGLAYVDSQSAEEMRINRGTLTEPGVDSPFHNRSAEESLRLFDEMKRGLHADGTHILRLKIDMASPNINLRDPAIYRIRHTEHHRTGDKWCVYPMYDYALHQRRAGAHHAFAVHAGVRGAPSALRLGA